MIVHLHIGVSWKLVALRTPYMNTLFTPRWI
jgi:hypothetical protein